MTKEQLAAQLNGREYNNEITPEEEEAAKVNGLVVVFGASDDLMEFRGAIDDELSAYDGTTAYLAPGGLLTNKCADNSCPYFEKIKEATTDTIKALWDTEGYSWVYETEMPHASFDIMEDGETYCRGIVVELPK
jgi:hypothetical protein